MNIPPKNIECNECVGNFDIICQVDFNDIVSESITLENLREYYIKEFSEIATAFLNAKNTYNTKHHKHLCDIFENKLNDSIEKYSQNVNTAIEKGRNRATKNP